MKDTSRRMNGRHNRQLGSFSESEKRESNAFLHFSNWERIGKIKASRNRSIELSVFSNVMIRSMYSRA